VRRIRTLFVIFSVCVLFACSSVDSDAKKAAGLMDKSMEATLEYDFEEAEKYYKQYKEIEDKYKNRPEQSDFERAYWQYKLKKES
jgi:hypothetical protein